MKSFIFAVCLIITIGIFIPSIYLCSDTGRKHSDIYEKSYVYPIYSAWVKQNGNSSNLTYEEWKILYHAKLLGNRSRRG
jgi:hypothetical protein